MTFPFKNLLEYQLQVVGAPSLFVAVSVDPNVTSNDTRNSMMETKVPDFCFNYMSRTIKCNHCSKLFVNQQGLFYTVKLKTNCIVFTDVSAHKIISILFKISASALFLKYSE